MVSLQISISFDEDHVQMRNSFKICPTNSNQVVGRIQTKPIFRNDFSSNGTNATMSKRTKLVNALPSPPPKVARHAMKGFQPQHFREFISEGEKVKIEAVVLFGIAIFS